MDKHGITIYTTYISVDLAHHEIYRAKVGKGGINVYDRVKIWSVQLTHVHISYIFSDYDSTLAFSLLFIAVYFIL